MEDWEFEGRRGIVIDHSKRLLVCGAAAQLTFGLDYFRLDYFHHIFLYPDTFYSDLAEAEVKGLTYSTGQVAFSWKDFEEGFRIDSDGYNLGLHEMAHALEVNHKKQNKSDKIIDLFFADFIQFSVPEHKLFVERGEGFLRQRALANEHEFFAVCVENFFEAPQKFKESLPDIFNHLCALLNQDPLNGDENYLLHPDFITQANQTSKKKIPGYLKTIKKPYTPRVLRFYSFLILPAIFFYSSLVKSNPDHQVILLIMMGLGAVLFTAIYFRSELWRDNQNAPQLAIIWNLLRGAALSVSVIFLFSHSFWSYQKNVRYRLNETTLRCDYQNCRLKNLSVFDYPTEYKYLANYYLTVDDIQRFEARNIPVYLEEHSKRGMFGLIMDYDFSIVAGNEYFYPHK